MSCWKLVGKDREWMSGESYIITGEIVIQREEFALAIALAMMLSRDATTAMILIKSSASRSALIYHMLHFVAVSTLECITQFLRTGRKIFSIYVEPYVSTLASSYGDLLRNDPISLLYCQTFSHDGESMMMSGDL